MHELEEAVEVADGEMLSVIENAIDALNNGDVDSAQIFIEEVEALWEHSGEMEMNGMDISGDYSTRPARSPVCS